MTAATAHEVNEAIVSVKRVWNNYSGLLEEPEVGSMILVHFTINTTMAKKIVMRESQKCLAEFNQANGIELRIRVWNERGRTYQRKGGKG